ncbi:MAG: hypothetical protein WB663_05935 [Beijerinckiaceae bacterium]
MSTIEIREAGSRADFDAFVEAAHRAQAGNKHYVPLLRDEMHWAFDKRKSPLVRENDVHAFVAYRDGIPIGRIASVVNRAHLAKYNDATGHFGLLQGIDDRRSLPRCSNAPRRIYAVKACVAFRARSA